METAAKRNTQHMTKTSGGKAPRYVIDSNCIIEGRNTIYAADIFPSLWQNMEGLVAAGEMCIPQEVIDEVTEKYDDSASSWVKTHKSPVALSSDQLADMEKHFSGLTGKWSHKDNATDLRIIATAKALGATVVTLEKPPGKYKIPTICHAANVKCISLMELLRQESWVFR